MRLIILTTIFYLFLSDALAQAPLKFSRNYKPKTLDEAILQLEKLHHDTTKRTILAMTEDQFTMRSHFGMGAWIRNNWRLWGNSKFSKYFNSIGIFHPDDMSGIILTSYYRHLQGRDLELDKQVEVYQEYWKASKEHLERLKTDTTYRRSYQQRMQYSIDSLEKANMKKSVNCFN